MVFAYTVYVSMQVQLCHDLHTGSSESLPVEYVINIKSHELANSLNQIII